MMQLMLSFLTIKYMQQIEDKTPIMAPMADKCCEK